MRLRFSGLSSGGDEPYRRDLFLVSLQPSLDAFAGFGGKNLGRRRLLIPGAPLHRHAQESDLLSIATAPSAEQEVGAKADPPAMFGGSPARNLANHTVKNIPGEWSIA